MKIFKFKPNLLSFQALTFSKSLQNQEMLNPSSSTLDEVVENIVQEVMRERVEQENQETALEEVREETEIEVKAGDAKAFYFDKGVDAFHKNLANKGFVEEKGFKELVEPFKNEVESRGWETVSQHMELGRRDLVKEFYANLGERKTLTCYVRGDGSLLGKEPSLNS